jgi:glycogen synthase
MNSSPTALRSILMTADTVGGVWTYALDLCRTLQPARVILATMGRLPDRSQRLAAAALPNVELEESDYPLEWMDDPWAGMAEAAKWLLTLERIHRPDIIHLNGYAFGSLSWSAPCVVVAHSCVLSWWRAVKREDAPPAWNRYASAVAAGLRAADQVVAPTRSMLNSLSIHYGFLRSTRVIANGCSENPATSAAKEPFVFCAGRISDEGKNITTLMRAAAGLPWPLILAGEAADVDSPPGRVKLLGRLSLHEVRRWMAHASIYAWPAVYEPFGLSVLEAAQSSCALVLSDIPSLRELWNGAAIFIPPMDTDGWREALGSLIADPASRHRLGSLAQRRARSFTSARMAAAYKNLYADLLAAEIHQPQSA